MRAVGSSVRVRCLVCVRVHGEWRGRGGSRRGGSRDEPVIDSLIIALIDGQGDLVLKIDQLLMTFINEFIDQAIDADGQ